jgi:tetratricopeptide (TPR) repeat protein
VIRNVVRQCEAALALALAAASTAASATEMAAVSPSNHRSIATNASTMFQLADSLTKSGQSEQAAKLFDLLARDPDAEIRSEALFRQAQLLEADGKDRAAAVMLRRILDQNPKASAVRLRLATVLQKLGDEDNALRQLRALRATDLPLNVARFVDRFAALLQTTKPFGVQVEFAMAPDSNINRASRSETVGTIYGDFSLDEKAKSGIGATIRTLAHARRPLADNLMLIGRVAADANLYRNKDFNDITIDLSGGPEWRLGRTRLSAEGGVGQQWFGMKPYQSNVRLAGSVTRAIGAVSQARLDIGARWINNRVNDLQDGRGHFARLRFERALTPQTLVSVFGGIDRYDARDDAYSTRAWNAGMFVNRDIGRMTLIAGAEYGRLRADERLALLPHARDETLTRFQIGTVLRQLTFAGFAPLTRLVVERNRSSVEYYDYKRVRTEFGVSRAF